MAAYAKNKRNASEARTRARTSSSAFHEGVLTQKISPTSRHAVASTVWDHGPWLHCSSAGPSALQKAIPAIEAFLSLHARYE